jgi:hypothetical protein
VFKQTIGIPMGTNGAPLVVDFFLRAYESDFLQGFLMSKDKTLVQTFTSNFCYIDAVLSLNNSRFGDYLHLIYQMSFK